MIVYFKYKDTDLWARLSKEKSIETIHADDPDECRFNEYPPNDIYNLFCGEMRNQIEDIVEETLDNQKIDEWADRELEKRFLSE